MTASDGNTWKYRLDTRRARLKRLIELHAPDVIIERECYLVLEAMARGRKRAIARFALDWLIQQWQNLRFTAIVTWIRVTHGVDGDEACDILLDRMEKAHAFTSEVE